MLTEETIVLLWPPGWSGCGSDTPLQGGVQASYKGGMPSLPCPHCQGHLCLEVERWSDWEQLKSTSQTRLYLRKNFVYEIEYLFVVLVFFGCSNQKKYWLPTEKSDLEDSTWCEFNVSDYTKTDLGQMNKGAQYSAGCLITVWIIPSQMEV